MSFLRSVPNLIFSLAAFAGAIWLASAGANPGLY
jgi:hypothetical protein